MRVAVGRSLILAVVVVAVAGCGPQLTPEEEIELLRSQYTAELTSITVKQDPGSGAAEATAGEEPPDVDDAAGLDLDQPPVRTDVVLDILVSTTSQDYLPGVTIDVQHVDAERREKDLRRLWVDTSSLVRGGGTQVTHVLEDVDYEVGDGFHVEVRSPVGEDERAEYREFGDA
ncbi:MAG: hypothetical protein R3190_10775 [Thermoanaerobaculia bacterium]|nr:hypothetical protein [Thermoanaerobaculia bacterium]